MDFMKFFFLTLALFYLSTSTSAQFQSRKKPAANSNLYAQLLSSLQANNDYDEVQKAVEDFNYKFNGIDYSNDDDEENEDFSFKRHATRETRNLCSVTGGKVDLSKDPEKEYVLPTYRNVTCLNTSRRPRPHGSLLEKCHGVGILNTVCANVERQEVFLFRPRHSNKPWEFGVRTVFDCHCMYVEW